MTGNSLAVATGQAAQMLLALEVLAQEEDGGLGEGPLQVDIPDLGPARAEPLAGRAVLAPDESAVGEEVLYPREASDVLDLVENHERQDLADAGHRAQAVKGLGIVLLGAADEVQLELADGLVVMRDHLEIDLDAPADVGVGEGLGHADTVGSMGDLRGGHGKVVLVVGVLDVGQEVAAAADQVEAPAEQIPRGPHLGRVDVGHGEVPAAEQARDLEGVHAVVLGLGAVDGLHVEGVAEDKVDALPPAEIGAPVPGEDALGNDDEALAVGRDGGQEGLRAAPQVAVEEDLALPVEDAEVQGPGVQVDPAVVPVGSGVESPGSLV